MSFFHDLRSPQDFFGSIQVIILVAFLFGLTPVRIVGNVGHRSMYLSRGGYLITLLHMGMFATTFILALVEGTSIVGYFFKSAVAQIGDSIQKTISLLGINYMYKSFFSNRRHLMALCERINKVDEEFAEIGVTFGYKRKACLTNLELVFIFFLNVAFITLANYVILRPNAIYPPYSVSYSFFALPVLISVVVIMFSVFVLRLQARFEILTKVISCVCLLHLLETFIICFSPQVLQNLVHQWDNKKNNKVNAIATKSRSFNMESFSMFTIASKSHSDIIQQSMEIHQLLCEAASIANKYFTYQLLTIISISFLIIVFDAYYVLETLLGKSKRENKFKTVEFVTFFSCQMFLYTIAIISIVEGSSRAINKVSCLFVFLWSLFRMIRRFTSH